MSAARRTRTSAAHRTNVLLEDIQSKFELVLEAVTSTRESLERKFEERFSAVEERLANLEFAVRQNSKDILALRKDVDELRKDVNDMRRDMTEMRKDLNQMRADFERRQELQRLAALERRVDALEKQRSA